MVCAITLCWPDWFKARHAERSKSGALRAFASHSRRLPMGSLNDDRRQRIGELFCWLSRANGVADVIMAGYFAARFRTSLTSSRRRFPRRWLTPASPPVDRREARPDLTRSVWRRAGPARGCNPGRRHRHTSPPGRAAAPRRRTLREPSEGKAVFAGKTGHPGRDFSAPRTPPARRSGICSASFAWFIASRG